MSPLLRSKPLRSKSDKAKARDLVLRKTKQAILRRANGHCEVGGEPFGDNRIDHHHVFGRHYLGDPWSDSAEAGAAVCREHHDFCELHPTSPAQRDLEKLAVLRLRKRVIDEGGNLASFKPGITYYRRAALLLVGELERLGVSPT